MIVVFDLSVSCLHDHAACSVITVEIHRFVLSHGSLLYLLTYPSIDMRAYRNNIICV